MCRSKVHTSRTGSKKEIVKEAEVLLSSSSSRKYHNIKH
jgi:hypothetical protein